MPFFLLSKISGFVSMMKTLSYDAAQTLVCNAPTILSPCPDPCAAIETSTATYSELHLHSNWDKLLTVSQVMAPISNSITTLANQLNWRLSFITPITTPIWLSTLYQTRTKHQNHRHSLGKTQWRRQLSACQKKKVPWWRISTNWMWMSSQAEAMNYCSEQLYWIRFGTM